MTFADAIRTNFAKYATFSGRAPRSEYWWFVLFVLLVGFALGIVDSALFEPGPMGQPASVLGGIWQLATLIPLLASGWRRMHDTGRTGLFLLYPLLAWFGTMAFLAFGAGISLAAFQGGADTLAAILTGATGIVGILAMLVVIISPLLVLWWLTRPSEPRPNAYGPNPVEVTA